MAQQTPFDQMLAKLDEALSKGRAMVRELHEAEQSLKLTIKEAKEVKQEVTDLIDSKYDAILTRELEKAREKIGSGQQMAYERAVQEFEKFVEPLAQTFRDIEARQRKIEDDLVRYEIGIRSTRIS